MNIRPLSQALQEKAERELNEIPCQIKENLTLFRNWLSQQNHLKYRDDDQILVNFLRSSKYSLERAKTKLDAFYTFRTLAPELTRDMDPFLPELQKVISAGIMCPLPLPKEDPTSSLYYVIRYPIYDPNVITASLLAKYQMINIEILLNESDNYIISGAKILWDLKNINYKTALQSTPTLIQQVVVGVQKSNPGRIKAIYIINAPSFFEPILSVVKRIVSKKMAKRMFIFPGDRLDEVHKHIPKSVLPEEYGGNAGPWDEIAANWKKTVENYGDKLLKENNYHSDESKRLGKPTTAESLFGVDGSFRKLEID